MVAVLAGPPVPLVLLLLTFSASLGVAVAIFEPRRQRILRITIRGVGPLLLDAQVL